VKKIVIFILIFILFVGIGKASAVPTKSKFYDFSEQLIDGEIKKPTSLYTNVRQMVKFERLLKLKISFLPRLFLTSKEKVFR